MIISHNNVYAFGCDKRWLNYYANIIIQNSSGPYVDGFAYCYGDWDSDNPNWGRSDDNGEVSLVVTLCEENYPNPPKRIKAKCIIKNRFDENPIIEKVTFKPNYHSTTVVLVPYN